MKVNPANSICSFEQDKIKKYEVNNEVIKSNNVPKHPTKENSLNDTFNKLENKNGIIFLSDIQKSSQNTDTEVNQNLNTKFNEVAGEPSIRDTRSKEDFPLQMKSFKDLKDQRFETNLRSPKTNEVINFKYR
jgi:hypothetical protein